MNYDYESELYMHPTPFGFDISINDVFLIYCAMFIFMMAQCMLLFNYSTYQLKPKFNKILITPFKDLTEFPSNQYFISKQKHKGKSVSTNKNKTKGKKYNKEEKQQSEEKFEKDGKKMINFECFTCGFKVNIDKSGIES